MKKHILFIASMLSALISFAQLNHGGEPLSWSLGIDSEVQIQTMPSLDMKTLRSEDKVNDEIKDSPYRFGKDHAADFNFFEEATSTNHENGTIYKMAIFCPDASSVGLLFDAFHLPKGASLFIYNEDRTELKGAFTYKNNKDSGIFPVGIIKDEKIILEYNGITEGAVLHISEVTHGYRNILNKWESDLTRDPFGESDECNINISCHEGNPWQEQKRSVVLITEGGENHCSGAIINNTLQDGTPYLLTANHCLGNPSGWVFYFNHESESCDGSLGPIDQSIAGGTLKATQSISDFALIELSEAIPNDFNVYYAGWDNSDATSVTNAVGIHHPSGDVKKISFEEDSPTPFITSSNNLVWNIEQWERGTVEGGSSGSPLFDQNGRIIGQLHGGRGSCNGTFTAAYADYYGRFGMGWDGSSSNTRMKDWLDPNNSGAIVLDGYGPNDTTYTLNAVNMNISQIPKVICTEAPFTPSFTFKNNGSAEITSATILTTFNGITQTEINWTGSLAKYGIETIQLDEMTPILGASNTIEVVISDINGTADETPLDNTILRTFDLPVSIPTKEDVSITINTDDYAYETSWRVKNAEGIDILAGGLFSRYDDFTTYEDTINFPADGCFSFTVYDNFGDGICCGGGDGSYSLMDTQGNILASGGEFGGRETIVLEKISDITSTENIELSNFVNVFPNPNNGILNIQIASDFDQADLRLINVLGHIVKRGKTTAHSTTKLDIQDLENGTYFLEIIAAGKKVHEKIILNR